MSVPGAGYGWISSAIVGSQVGNATRAAARRGMASFEITCADCGTPHTAASPKAKYCNVCRVFRDLVFVGDTTKSCFGCGEKFAPVRRKDLLCSKCDYHHTVYSTGTCGICKADSTITMRSDIAVGVDCCMRKPGETRRKFVRAVQKKRAERMAAARTA